MLHFVVVEGHFGPIFGGPPGRGGGVGGVPPPKKGVFWGFRAKKGSKFAPGVKYRPVPNFVGVFLLEKCPVEP